MSSTLVKYEEDLLTAFQNIYFKIEKTNDNLSKALNIALTPVIMDILNSYYFEDLLKPELKKRSDYRAGMFEISYNGYYNETPFISLESLDYANRDEFKDLKLNVNKEEIINELIKIDPHYKVIFEKDSLKQKLNLLKKFEIEYTIVRTNEIDTHSIFSEFHKVWSYKKNFSKNESLNRHDYSSAINNNLKYFDKMEFFNLDFERERIFVVAHNHNQIAGLSLISPYVDFNMTKVRNDDYFLKNKIFLGSYLMIGNQFRGKGLSSELLEKTFEYVDSNNGIFIRTHPTVMGKDRLYEKGNQMNIDRKNSFIINHLSEGEFRSYQNLIRSIKNENEYNVFRKSYQKLFRNLAEITSNYERMMDDTDNYEYRNELRMESLELQSTLIKLYDLDYKKEVLKNNQKNRRLKNV